MKKVFTTLFCMSIFGFSSAQWSPAVMKGKKIMETAKVANYYKLDLNAMRFKLSAAEKTGKGSKPVEIYLPMVNGKIEKFAVYSFPVVDKAIADQYQLGSYVGVGIDDPQKTVRFSVAPNDFQSMVMKGGEFQFIEPQNTDKSVYGVHEKTHKTKGEFLCTTSEAPLSKAEIAKLLDAGKSIVNNPADFSKSSDRKYRTLRLALSVTGEYTNYFGGVAGAMTAINATLTRCNGIFEKDFALHLNLQNFPQLIYTDPVTDPYSDGSTGSNGTWSTELQNTLTSTIGNGAYDIGHLFGATGSGGGNAGCIGCVCVDDTSATTDKNKGSAYTSPPNGVPQGDNFDLDYVAHEMGHQLGANHTFSHVLEDAGVNIEPGSGSTIMGYAGITSANVQQHSDPYFHGISIGQVEANMQSKVCGTETAIANRPPVISPLTNYTIPKGTAFVLTANATDPEGDALTYTWEQMDNASTAVTSTTGNNVTGALFRSLPPTTSPTRYFPKFSSVMAGQLTIEEDWESVAYVARDTNFRVTVRDNNANAAQQQTQYADVAIIVGAEGPFEVTSTKVYNNSKVAFLWNTAGTNLAPYNSPNVKIDYTLDNGATWTVIAASTPNDGSEVLNWSSLPTDTNLKIRVSSIGNIFYAVGPAIVSAVVSCNGTAPAALQATNITTVQASLTWEPVSGASYVVRYKKVSGATWIEVPLSINNYTLTGLEESSQYEVQVAAVCSGTRGAFSTSVLFNTMNMQYCEITSADSTDEYISNVTVTSNSGITMNNSSGANNYTDYSTDATKVINLVQGSTNNTLSVSITWPGTIYNEVVTAWIDFNRDGLFDEVTEKILATAPSQQNPVTTIFSVPANSYAGDKLLKMRVILKYSVAPTDACANFTYGEVEDYAVKISPTLGVNDGAAEDNTVKVYPNPAVDVLNVTKVSNKADYQIFNMAGQVVAKGKVADNKVNVTKLLKGVYVISVEEDGNATKVKFIKK